MYQITVLVDLEAIKKYARLAHELQDEFFDDAEGCYHKPLGEIASFFYSLRSQIERAAKAGQLTEAGCPDKLEPAPPKREMTDRLALVICEGHDAAQDEAEYIAAWQWLIDKRIAYTAEGSLGRIANRLIREGVCISAPDKPRIITNPGLLFRNPGSNN